MATVSARRLARVFGGISAILLLLWLIRGFLTLTQLDADYFVIISFGFIGLSRLFSTKTRRGAGRAVSSFLWNVAAACITMLFLIWFLGWVASIQGGPIGFPTTVSGQFPNLVIVAIATGLAAYAARELSPRSWRMAASKPAILVNASTTLSTGRTSVSAKADTVGLPVKKGGKTVGCVVVGDMAATIDTPMGKVAATLPGPVTTFGMPVRGSKASDSQVTALTGKTVGQLLDQVKVDSPTLGLGGDMEDEVDLPFIHVRRNEIEEAVDVGPISVRRDPSGERVRIGGFTIDSDDDDDRHHRHHEFPRVWMAKSAKETCYLAASDDYAVARWNGSSLKLRRGSMKMTVGEDGFEYSPSEVETHSPLHSLRVTGEKAVLTTKKFTLNVDGDRVIVRGAGGSKSSESPGLAKDLKALLADTAKKQVQSVMEGQPIDLDEMLAGTDELLSKYG